MVWLALIRHISPQLWCKLETYSVASSWTNHCQVNSYSTGIPSISAPAACCSNGQALSASPKELVCLLCRGAGSTVKMVIDKSGREADHIRSRWNCSACSSLMLGQVGIFLSKSAAKLVFHGTLNFLLRLIAKPQLSGSLSGGCFWIKTYWLWLSH